MLSWIAGFIIIAGLLLLAAWLLRGYLSGGQVPTGIFGGAKEKRLGVVETASIDGRRKLLLVQRDGVEHLIMTGGPIDVVVETGIERKAPAQTKYFEPSHSVDGPEPPSLDRIRQAASRPGE